MQLHDLPDGARILPGMPVQADIKIGHRTVINFLMSRYMPPSSEAVRAP
jgi:HlyD family secretion protein